MAICISSEGCKKNNISIGGILYLLSIHNNVDFNIVQKELIEKGYLTTDRNSLFQQIGWRVTKKGIGIIDSVILDSDREDKEDKNNALTRIAIKLKELFPKGKKDGTNYYWTEGVALITRRLKLFFKKYGATYTEDQIVNATRKYVQSFNGNYTYMRLLKYFILKEKVGASGEVEGDSELINYIENAGQEDELKNDWTSTLK